jgi:putative restriction endonuclease
MTPLGNKYLKTARLGQGSFRITALNLYNNTCCITGETTQPVLEAAHILPISQKGTHSLNNALLLRADIHILYDQGLVGIDDSYRVRVSGQIRDQYLNGKAYYTHEGAQLRSLPEDPMLRPDRDLLRWHMSNVFVP